MTQDEICAIPARTTNRAALSIARHEAADMAAQEAHTVVVQAWLATEHNTLAADELEGEIAEIGMDGDVRAREATPRQLRPRTPGLDMNEDSLAHEALMRGLNPEPPDETAIARLVEVHKSAGKGS
jgi:hypothetical protein